jgi:long-chain acyl-CoA synthetase
MHLLDATRFSPQFIENKLKFSPYIKECVCLWNELDFIASMICIDYPNVGKWAESRRINYTTYTDLAGKTEVVDLIAKELAKVNETLPAATRIRKFLLLYKELDADDDELTRTRKVRRAFVGDRYQHVIEGMYAGQTAIPIDAVIKYQDGKTSNIKTTLVVKDM